MVMAIVPVVFVVLFCFLPESPQQLLKNKNNAAAERSLRFYRNIDTNSNAELNGQLQSEFEKFKSIAQQNESNPPLRVADFRKMSLYIRNNAVIILANSVRREMFSL